MGKRIITEFELKKIINAASQRLEKSIEADEKDIAKKGLEKLPTLEQIAKKGPKQ